MSVRHWAVFLLCANTSAAHAAVDGKWGVDDLYGPPVAVQDTPTGFGDNVSELDAAYARLDAGGNLSLLVTGNLEGNGNGIVLLLDTRAGGAVASAIAGGYGVLGSIGGTRVDDWGLDIDGGATVSPTPGGGSILDPGFNPDIAIEMNAFGGSSYFINIIDLAIPNDGNADIDRFLGSNAVGAVSASQFYSRSDANIAKGHGGGVTHAFDNSNLVGITDSSAAGALTATTGFELVLSSTFLATTPGHQIKGMAYISNGSGDYLSNQILGETGLAGAANLGSAAGLGGTPLFDAREFAGNQFFVVPVPEPSPLVLELAAALPLLIQRRRVRKTI